MSSAGMRLAIIADIHGNVLALEAVIADIARRGVDRTINLGDCVSGPLWPRETVDLLSRLTFPTVRGNHDRWVAEMPREAMSSSDAFAFDCLSPAQREWLGALPTRYGPHPGIVGVHGTPDGDNRYLLEEIVEGQLVLAASATIETRLAGIEGNVLLCAHSHLPRLVYAPGGKLVLNPGSVGCPAYADATAPAHVAEVASPHARYAVLTGRDDEWSAEFVALQYDWGAASRRAGENGRPEWARALATGFTR
jgi:predicted phosphodiesterase